MGQPTLRELIAGLQTIFLDTMVFVYVLENNPHLAEAASTVLALVEAGEVLGVTSALTLAELFTAPAQAGDPEAVQDYQIYLTNFPHLTLLPLDPELAPRVAMVRARTGLPTADAIQLATAEQVGVDAIVTNDRRWCNRTGEIQLILLGEHLG